MANEIITQDYLHKIFEYRDGNFYWKVKLANRTKIGDKAGSLNCHGYIHIGINGKLYQGHRLIFLYHYGYLPQYLDHINGIKNDNQIENLRKVTKAQNFWNTPKPKNNKSGCKNVSWHKSSKKWRVQIGVNSEKKVLGYFNDLELADLVAQEARRKYHTVYASHK